MDDNELDLIIAEIRAEEAREAEEKLRETASHASEEPTPEKKEASERPEKEECAESEPETPEENPEEAVTEDSASAQQEQPEDSSPEKAEESEASDEEKTEEPAEATEGGEPTEQAEEPASEPKPRRPLPHWVKTLLLILGTAVVTAGISAIIAYRTADNYIWKNYSVTISQEYADGSIKRTTTLINEPVELETPPAVENRTFAGWRSRSGELIAPGEITAQKTETYTAEYKSALDLKNHKAYIFPDENGFFHLEDNMTRGDTALMLYNVFAGEVNPGRGFFDVPRNSEYYIPTATLRALGVCSGMRFSPDADITRGEFFEMLSAFFAPTSVQPAFRDIAVGDDFYDAMALAAENGWIESGEDTEANTDGTLTRKDVVLLMNRILGRDGESEIPEDTVWGILEYRPGDEMYIPLLEAAVTHEYVAGTTEKWSSGVPVADYGEGFRLLGKDLYYIDADGHFARNMEEEGFLFDENGRYTSGDAELDALVEEVIDDYWEPDISREDLLRRLYDFTVNSFVYKRRTYYKNGDCTYAVEAAKIMLSERTGNCYNYAATFCMLSRRLGCDAAVFSGTVGMNADPHGWCELNIDGVAYICDAELEMKGGMDMYMKTYEDLNGWTYIENYFRHNTGHYATTLNPDYHPEQNKEE